MPRSKTPLIINGVTILPGTRAIIDLPAGKLYTHTPLTLPVHVVYGTQSGPRLFISAAVHGDEINGVEIIRRLLKLPVLKQLRGALICVPIVNVHGLINHSRYLPDRRDLNRSFPGSDQGSVAARLAHLFMREIVANSTHGIDLHTGTIHRENLPQIRANLSHTETRRLARAFGVPVLISSTSRDGSLREAAAEAGVPMLLYEAGEALRFNEIAIRAGVKGIVNVMRELKMLPPGKSKTKDISEPYVARSSYWVRAAESGVLRALAPLGTRVKKDTLLGVISDPFGQWENHVYPPYAGIVIGRTNLPLVNEGDAIYHIARFDQVKEVAANLEAFHEALGPDTYADNPADGQGT